VLDEFCCRHFVGTEVDNAFLQPTHRKRCNNFPAVVVDRCPDCSDSRSYFIDNEYIPLLSFFFELTVQFCPGQPTGEPSCSVVRCSSIRLLGTSVSRRYEGWRGCADVQRE